MFWKVVGCFSNRLLSRRLSSLRCHAARQYDFQWHRHDRHPLKSKSTSIYPQSRMHFVGVLGYCLHARLARMRLAHP